MTFEYVNGRMFFLLVWAFDTIAPFVSFYYLQNIIVLILLWH